MKSIILKALIAGIITSVIIFNIQLTNKKAPVIALQTASGQGPSLIKWLKSSGENTSSTSKAGGNHAENGAMCLKLEEVVVSTGVTESVSNAYTTTASVGTQLTTSFGTTGASISGSVNQTMSASTAKTYTSGTNASISYVYKPTGKYEIVCQDDYISKSRNCIPKPC